MPSLSVSLPSQPSTATVETLLTATAPSLSSTSSWKVKFTACVRLYTTTVVALESEETSM